MPVTSFAADPYARQHGIAVEGGKRLQEDMTGIQKAMLETSADQTMEIKLNVLNDTVELQRVGDMAPVSEEAIGRVLDSPAPLEPDEQPAPLPQEPVPQEPVEEIPPEDVSVEELPAPPEVEVRETVVYNEPASQVREVSPAPEAAAEPVQEAAPAQPIQEMAEEQPVQEATPAAQAAPESQPVFEDVSSQTPAAPAPAEQPAQPEVTQEATQVLEPPVAQQPAAPCGGEDHGHQPAGGGASPRWPACSSTAPAACPPTSSTPRCSKAPCSPSPRSCARPLRRPSGKTPPSAGCATRSWKRPSRPRPLCPTRTPASPSTTTPGPEDAKSISHELRGEMRELTLRMMITGVCTVLLVLVNLIFGGQITGPGTGLPAGGVRGAHLGVFGRGSGRVLPHRAQRPESPVLL